jgi:hypothetical protein
MADSALWTSSGDGVRTEQLLASEAEERAALRDWFRMELDPEP